MHDRQTLTGASTDFLGGEERIIEFGNVVFGYSTTVIADADHRRVAPPPRAAVGFAGFDIFAGIVNGVSRVHDEIEEYLVELADVANHGRQRLEAGIDLRHIFVFVGG